MTPTQFLREVRKDDVNILHAAATADNFDAMNSLSALPFFSEVVNDGDNEVGWTPLLCACVNSHKQDLRMIKLLVESGASLLKSKKDGLTSVHFAASNNDIHFLDYIMEQVDNKEKVANIKTADGWTPAHYAGFLGNFDSLNLLIENGADLKARNSNQLSTFDEIVRNDHAELFECVWPLASQVKRDLNEKGSFSFVHLAAGNKSAKTLKFLLESKESANQICNYES